MKRRMMALGAVAILNSGCGEIELSPFPGGWGSGASAPDPGGSAAGPSVIAMRAGDAPPDLSDRFFGPSGVDPDSLVLFFSSVVQECARPFVAIRCDNAPIWRFILIVPPELDAPGFIDLSDPQIGFDESFAYPDCSGGGSSGAGFQGTLEIVSSDETSLFVKLRGASDETLSLDGDYTVERCGAAAAPAPGE